MVISDKMLPLENSSLTAENSSADINSARTEDVDPPLSFMEKIKSDAKNALKITYMVCFLLIVITTVTSLWTGREDERFKNNSLYDGESKFGVLFQFAIVFTLSVSLPVYIDIALAVFSPYIQEDLMNSRDFSRFMVLITITIPNIFILFQGIPSSAVDFVMYCQYAMLFLIVVYRIYTLSSAQKVVCMCSMREIFLLLNISIFFAFLYDLSIHDLIPGRKAFKALFVASMIMSHLIALYKIYKWCRLSSRISEVSRNIALPSIGTVMSLALSVLFSVVVMLVQAIAFEYDYMFFPQDYRSYVAMEWFYGFTLLIWTAVRNFEVRKSEVGTRKQLEFNRKMTRSISHEIRTPLNTAFMALELLISTLTSAELKPNLIEQCREEILEIASSVKEGCDISLGILNQLLTFEKLSAGMMQLENKLISVDQLLESNIKLFKMQAQQVGIIFRVDKSEIDTSNIKVYVDEHKMNQVLRNLLSNAMKFTPKGGVVEIKLQWLHPDARNLRMKPLLHNQYRSFDDENRSSSKKWMESLDGIKSPKSISVTQSSLNSPPSLSTRVTNFFERSTGYNATSTSEPATKRSFSDIPVPMHEFVGGCSEFGTLLVSVIDSGPGVSKDDQKKLFHEYVQINPGELQKGQGTGLGLSISKAIVHLHGGLIGMTSEGKGSGSTFFVELPSYIVEKRERDNDSENNSISIRTKMKLQKMFSPGKLVRASSKKVLPILKQASMGLALAVMREANDDSSEDDVETALKAKKKKRFSKIKVKEAPVRDLEMGIPNNIAAHQPSSSSVRQSQRHSQRHSQREPPRKMSLEHKRSDLDNEVISNVIDFQKVTSETFVEGIVESVSVQSDTPRSDDSVEAPKVETRRRKFFNQSHPSFNRSFQVLLVDDSVANRKMLGKLLSREGHFITEAGDGTEAVTILKDVMKNPATSYPMFDFILMDYFMIKMNGPEATTIIRKLGYNRPIIGVTGALDDDSEEFVKAGADLVLCKPVTMQNIWKGLKSINFSLFVKPT